MNKRFFRQLMVVLLVALCLSLFSGTVLAAESQSLQIPIVVQQTGQLIETGDLYTFALRADQADFPMPEGSSDGVYELEIVGAGSGVIDIAYDELGVYTYTLYQVAGQTANCQYDDTVYTLKVYVTVDDSGKQELTAVLTNGQEETKLEKAVFVNTYSAGDPAEVTPTVQKVVRTVSGLAPKDTEFSFTLTPEDQENPMPNHATGAVTVKRTGAGSVSFGTLSFDADCVGHTYVYSISEVQGKAEGFTYDKTVYRMTVSVSAKEGKILTDVSYQNADGEAVDALSFTNTYEEPADTMPQTGQPWVPVMALALLGVLLMTVGGLMKRKRAGY